MLYLRSGFSNAARKEARPSGVVGGPRHRWRAQREAPDAQRGQLEKASARYASHVRCASGAEKTLAGPPASLSSAAPLSLSLFDQGHNPNRRCCSPRSSLSRYGDKG